MQPIIFLDIDGVLTTPASGWKIVPVLLDRVLRIADATEAVFVISSSWREDSLEKTLAFLPPVLRPRVSGQTPDLGTDRKGVEVKAYLKEHPTEHWCILDDQVWPFLGEQLWNFVPVEMDRGLTEDNVEDAISILLGLKPKPSFIK